MERHKSGWWQGEIGNQIGKFPSNYCAPLITLHKSPETKRPKSQSTPAVYVSKDVEPYQTVIALHDYEKRKVIELSLKKGNIIKVIAQHDSGWWDGELNGQIGKFPINYCKSLERPMSPPISDIAKEGLKMVALYSFNKRKENELSLKKGDVVTVLEQNRSGWWKGQINGEIGRFPSNFCRVLEEAELEELQFLSNEGNPNIMLSTSPTQHEDEQIILNTIQKLQAAAEQGIQLQQELTKEQEKLATETPTSPNSDVEQTETAKPKEEETSPGKKFPQIGAYPLRQLRKSMSDLQKFNRESEGKKVIKMRALYSFNARKSTELSFKKGDVLVLLWRDAKNGWWKGEIDGKQGNFPSNYCEFLNDTPRSNQPWPMALDGQQPEVQSTLDNLKVKALYSFTKRKDTEISFSQGDIIRVLRQHKSGWWKGELNGQTGLFPSNYCKIIEETST